MTIFDTENDLENLLIRCAQKGAQYYAESHPRPTRVNAVQAAEMLSCSAQTVRKMIREGRIKLNSSGLISISEIDNLLVTSTR